MAKNSRRAVRSGAAPPGAEAAEVVARPEAGTGEQHFVVFQIADGAFALRLDDVGEIVRMPRLAQMPLAPRSLLGLANLRGVALPVVSVRRLLGWPDAPPDEATRLVVMGRGAPVAFMVDRIHHLLAIPQEQIERADAAAGSVNPDLLAGAIKGAEGDSTIKILDPARLLRKEFAQLGRGGPRAHAGATTTAIADTETERRQRVSLVSLVLAQQEYALPLDRVREIIPLPEQISEVPRSETAVLGVVTLRDRLLPLVSLRALLGMPSHVERKERGKVVVMAVGGGSVGMVADGTREILRVDPDMIDPAPALLTRGAGDAEISAICRLEGGKRLVAVLSPDRLLRSELMARVLADQSGDEDTQSATKEHAMDDEQFVVFKLGDQDYGLPIGAVEEIARRPASITRIPKAPKFIDGVMNLRGAVVPIIDLRRRFELGAREPSGSQRILVLAVRERKAGFMVDGVSEVLKVPAEFIRPAPELSREQMRLIGRVANLDLQGRMILLIDPAHLLDQVEEDALIAFARANRDRALAS